MGARDIPLNDLQLEILAWVRDGSPDGVYSDYRPRIVARALHHRGLVAIAGHGPGWQATLTDDGDHYLQHGVYPPAPAAPAPMRQPAIPEAAPRQSPPKAEPRPRKTPRVGPTDAMMNALAAAADHRIEIEYAAELRYRQLALSAERFKKIPDGMQVTVTADYSTRTAHVTLESQPEWRTRVLEPIPVPSALRDPSDVVVALQKRDDLEISAADKKRALRLVQALVAEARRRTYTVTTMTSRAKDQWGYVRRPDENTGHLKITIGPDEYRLSTFQVTEKVEHVATKGELARAGRGWALPKWDYIPTPVLGIRIEGPGPAFWGAAWTDREDRLLDDVLAQILQELELRHDTSTERRLDDERQRIERQRQWEAARDAAIEALTDSHRTSILLDQVTRWSEVAKIRDYATSVEKEMGSQEPEAREAGIAWVRWARNYADRIDPLRQPIRVPGPPPVSPTTLKPFMGHWSPYGPQ
jgi:hypothetical protein